MAKQLKITYNNKVYTLEFTRASIRQLESSGFKIASLDDAPVTAILDFVAGAFVAHHRFEKRAVIEEIYDNLKNKSGFLEKLVELYSEPVLSLMEDNDAGNAEWTLTE